MVKKKQLEKNQDSNIPRIGIKLKPLLSKISKKNKEKGLRINKKIVNKIVGSKKLVNKNKKLKESQTKKENKCKEKEKEENLSDQENSDSIEEQDESVSEDEDILKTIELEYTKLETGNQAMKKENVCSRCEMPNGLIECQGTCQQSFHLNCVGLLAEPKEPFKCDECTSDAHSCFLCKKPSSKENNMITKKCSQASCGRYYHEECVMGNEKFRKENSNKQPFTCPLHICTTCYAENISDKSSVGFIHASKGRFVKCIRCPVAYHVGEHCLPAGSVILNSNYLVCPAHLNPTRNKQSRTNVTWCFVCCKSGDLIGCNTCPAAYHSKCLESPDDPDNSVNENGKIEPPASPSTSDQCTPMVDQLSPVSNHSASTTNSSNTLGSAISVQLKSNWTCEDCLIGKRPLYGQIVWAKVGHYRWWPAQICLPRNLPEKVKNYPHQVGEFPVKFFGSYDFYWLSIGRCFVFAEGDEFAKSGSEKKNLAIAYEEGVKQAKVAFKEVERLKEARNSKTNVNKYNFTFIKTNKPVGNVLVNKLRFDEIQRCECDPKQDDPCGSDTKCINRMLNHECHPGVCLAGESCQNQRFVKRLYPKQEPFFTGSRGWGLRCLVDIKKGDFINEYVGELINDEECKRRLELAHKNDIRNFYFLAIEKDRIIDAGPKGNLSRFANHSCEPNMETQKWSVNGDVRVGLFAKIDIPAFTELTFNYNLDCLRNEKAMCKCGAKNCSGFIGERPKNNASSSGSNTSLKSSENSNGSQTNSKKRKLNITSKTPVAGVESNENKNSKKRSVSLTPKEAKNLKQTPVTPKIPAKIKNE